MRSITP